jgi:hypothetical protein
VIERDENKAIDTTEPEHHEPSSTREPWETPEIEELAVQLSALRPGVGRDGGMADCSHT